MLPLSFQDERTGGNRVQFAASAYPRSVRVSGGHSRPAQDDGNDGKRSAIERGQSDRCAFFYHYAGGLPPPGPPRQDKGDSDTLFEVIPKLSRPPPSQKRALNVVERSSLSSLPNDGFMPSNSTVPGALPTDPRTPVMKIGLGRHI